MGTYKWLKDKLENDLNHYGSDKVVFVLINKNRNTCEDYFISYRKIPDPARLYRTSMEIKK
ncbi:hypothetical protein [Marinilactibacillus sp. Marseille-P9653]|uniref:hypothetical protein n=1 Tax=Marinilactibacillus sp. Marseille-P9653 TaxID=2866583 RepID=UPI001CE3FFA3|nr:hypothetical protein [Marinilactibacillus sp. Marseille-P9653]